MDNKNTGYRNEEDGLYQSRSNNQNHAVQLKTQRFDRHHKIINN